MSFLKDYSLFASGNESPVVYHRWAALSAISSFIGRKVWMDMGVYTTYPNMYILLVGKAGIKKSTAMNIARNMARELNLPISPPSITKEALTQLMAEDDSPCQITVKGVTPEDPVIRFTQLSVFANEFVTLLNSGGNASGMIELFTDIWDQDAFEVKTKNKGTDTIVGPYITMLGCLTTEIMNNLANTKIISSGFSRRCVFVYSEDYGTPIAIPKITQEQKDAWVRCINRAKEIRLIRGAFVWGPGSEQWFTAWYNELHLAKQKETRKAIGDFLQTKPEYVIKLAMLIALSEGDELVLTVDKLELAVAFLDEVAPSMEIIFEGSGRNELAGIAEAIARLICNTPQGLPVKRIQKLYYDKVNTQELEEIMAHLIRTERIRLVALTHEGVTVQVALPPKGHDQVDLRTV